jgi:heme-degrading monooxygenase HmoA
MTEFSDFLRHRFAYVAIGEFKPGKFAEAKQLFEQAIATYSQGFKGAYLLQEPGTDKGIAIIFWENMEDIESNQTDVYKEILSKMSHLFAKAPKTGFHEVASLIQPSVASSVLN